MTPLDLLMLRKRYGLNQTQAAQRCNVSRETYNRWENGKTSSIPENVVAQLTNTATAPAADARDAWQRVCYDLNPDLYEKNKLKGLTRKPTHPGFGDHHSFPVFQWELYNSTPPLGGTADQLAQWQARIAARAAQAASISPAIDPLEMSLEEMEQRTRETMRKMQEAAAMARKPLIP